MEGLHLLGDVQDGLEHLFQHIHHQADQADQGQHQTDRGNQLHPHNGGVHSAVAVVAQFGSTLQHLVQLGHQGGQVGLDRTLIVILRLGGVGRHHALHLAHRLVQRLVHGLDLIPQRQKLRVVRSDLAIDPLTQHALGIICAGELSAGVQRLAQVAGPFVVCGLGGLNLRQQRARLHIVFLHTFDPKQIEGRHSTEQEYRHQCRDHPDENHLFDTFSHSQHPHFFPNLSAR